MFKLSLRPIYTLFVKEFLSLVKRPMFLFVASFYTLILSFSYLRSLFTFSVLTSNPYGGGAQNIHYTVFADHISLSHIILLFVIPVFTMRLISEEKKLNTFALLMTAPITSFHISFGKFLAAWGAVGILVFLSMVYPLIVWFFGDFSMPQLLLSYLGLFLVSMFYVSMGLFASSLSRSLVLSVILGILLNILAIVILGQAPSLTDNAMMIDFLKAISLQEHFLNFIKGVFKLSSLFYFFSIAGFFIFLTERIIEALRWR